MTKLRKGKSLVVKQKLEQGEAAKEETKGRWVSSTEYYANYTDKEQPDSEWEEDQHGGVTNYCPPSFL
jgi:hypothetical protein